MAVFRGTTGDDQLTGGASDDVLIGWAGDDRLEAGAGDDVLVAGFGPYALAQEPDDGRDPIVGGEEDLPAYLPDIDGIPGLPEQVIGGIGREGADRLSGGSGQDRFVVSTGEGAPDTIVDFEPGDRITATAIPSLLPAVQDGRLEVEPLDTGTELQIYPPSANLAGAATVRLPGDHTRQAFEFDGGTVSFASVKLDTLPAAFAGAALYVAFAGRDADAPGLRFWTQRLEAQTKDGGSISAALAEVGPAFARSAEAVKAYPFLADDSNDAGGRTAFVQDLYTRFLSRQPDEAGLDHWVEQLDGAAIASDVVLAFLEGAVAEDASAAKDRLLEAVPAEVDVVGTSVPGASALATDAF